jgi:replicative DNA helicase
LTAMPAAPPVSAMSSVELEQAFLGAMLLNREVLGLVPDLKPEHFSEPLHQKIFSAAVEMIEAGRQATPITVGLWFHDAPPIDGTLTVGKYLGRLTSHAITIIGAPGYAREIIDLASRRALVAAAAQLSASASSLEWGTQNAGTEAIELISDALAMLRRSGTSWTPDKALEACLTAGTRPIITSGIAALDEAIGGLQPGMFTIVAGRPGMGKTVFAESLARATSRAGNPVLLFSKEMSYVAMWARFLSDEAWNNSSPISYGRILRGKLDEYQAQRIRDAHKLLLEYPLEIDDRSGLTVGQIAQKCRQVADKLDKQGKKLKLVIVDHLGKIDPGDRYRGQKTNETGHISNGLMNLCRELGANHGTALIAFSQLNRASEGGPDHEDKIPDLTNLRNSGDLEQDARIVMGLFRPAYYLEKRLEKAKADERLVLIDTLTAKQNEYRIQLLKNDSGPTSAIDCSVDIRCSAVRNKGVVTVDRSGEWSR